MVTEGTTFTVMLADKGAMYALDALGQGLTEWVQGCLRLKDEFVQGAAKAAAERVGGTVKKVWFDNGAGGYFADIEVA